MLNLTSKWIKKFKTKKAINYGVLQKMANERNTVNP